MWNRKYVTVLVSLVLMFLVFCACNDIPMETASSKLIYPDYTDLIIPPDIAPLNFSIIASGNRFRTTVEYGDGLVEHKKGRLVRFSVRKWKSILSESVGREIRYKILSWENGEWKPLYCFSNRVSCDSIDSYVSYRLIEPGYSNYGAMSLEQRNLTNFRKKDIFNNKLLSGRVEQQCINCHSFQANKADKFQFHVRQLYGGTVIAENDHIKKVDLKRGELISSGVYPSWHPSENMIAYSVNSTNQVFLRNDRQRLEVYDSASDIILYDIDNDEISPVLCDNRSLETFPAWSYDGKVLFYASADLDSLGIMPDENVADRYDDIKYSIKAIRYDAEKGTFSTPVSIFDAPADCLSAVTPRPSPDGRFVLSAVGSYGSFHIWHDDSDLYITNLEDGETQPLDGANSPRADSFHSWSSNSRWIVFASRRDDRTYSRLYISYIDEHGKASKPFLLPQKNPFDNLTLTKSFNVPELTFDKVSIKSKSISKVVVKDKTENK